MTETNWDWVGAEVAKIEHTPTRKCVPLERVCTHKGQVVEWTMVCDHTICPMVIIGVRASDEHAIIVIGDQPITLKDLPDHGTVRLPKPLIVRPGTPIKLDPGQDGFVELIGFEFPVQLFTQRREP